jgi:hypothetical protein
MSRPRKNLLLYCANPVVASVTGFTIESRSRLFRVWRVDSRAVAMALIGQHAPGYFEVAMVIRTEQDEAVEICHDVSRAGLRTLFMGQAEAEAEAEVCLRGNVCVAEWMERLRIMGTRRRGPKGQKRVVSCELVVGSEGRAAGVQSCVRLWRRFGTACSR